MPGWGDIPWGVGSWGLGSTTGENLGFEIAGPEPGDAEDWLLVPVVTGLTHLEFAEGVVEPFSWDGDLLLAATDDLAFSDGDEEVFSWFGLFVEQPPFVEIIFNSLNPDPKLHDDFETYWSGNHLWLADFVGVGTDLTAVLFDGPVDTDGFEAGWENDAWPTDFVGVGTDLTAVLFDGAASEDVEDFNEVAPDREFLIQTVASDTLTTVGNHGLAADDRITFRNELGVLPQPLLEDPTPFYVYSGVGNLVQVAYTPGALTPVDILDFGTGVHYLIYDRSIFWTTTF